MSSTDHPPPTSPPPAAAAARLVVLDGCDVGQKWLVRGPTRIGRGLDNDVVIDDVEVSREHAVITPDRAGGFVLHDLESRNGSTLNGAPVLAPEPLHFGDKIRLGPRVVLVFTSHDPIEDQLLQRQRLETLGRLTAGVAHDLNNMLGAVTSSAAFLRQLSDRSGPEALECLDDIDKAAKRAGELAAHLLSFARARVTRELIDMSALCLDAARLTRRTFERTIELRVEVKPRIFVEGDPSQIHQVLMNLLVNARDALSEGGGHRIVLRLDRFPSPDDGEVVLQVEDDGRGMDTATVGRIFEPYFTTKREGVGFGVGLATVHDIVTSHGGRIEVESAPGRGSRFRVVLKSPSRGAQRARRATQALAPSPRRLPSGQRIVLVDDELVLQRSLARVLRRAGYEVEPFADGESALGRLEAPPAVDLVILDLDLPGMRGQDVLREMRTRGHVMPVVCISGHRDALEHDDDTAREMSAFLPKPFAPNLLLQAIEEALGEPSAPDDPVTLSP